MAVLIRDFYDRAPVDVTVVRSLRRPDIPPAERRDYSSRQSP